MNLEIFEQFEKKHKQIVVLVDGMNLFIRNFAANTMMDLEGNPIGGAVGFLKSLLYYVDILKPNKMIVCWDGKGGADKRKKIYSEYKTNSKPLKINRFYEEDKIKEQIVANKIFQMQKLDKILSKIPVFQVRVEKIEADDSIAYISEFEKGGKIIASDDRDFFQLIKDDVIVFRPTKKKFMNCEELRNEFGIHASNFLLARSMLGNADASDNIRGIKGVGFKKVNKLFPELYSDKKHNLNDIIDICDKKRKDNAFYGKISESRDIVARNIKLMKLSTNILSLKQMEEIKMQLENQNPQFDKMGLLSELLSCGIDSLYRIPVNRLKRLI